jgi:hypothetical protein
MTQGNLNMNAGQRPSVLQFCALQDDELERTDVAALNLAVASEISALSGLDPEAYDESVTRWTNEFADRLPVLERHFCASPHHWKSDIRLFRVGMLQGFLGHEIGIRYIEEQKRASVVHYTDAGSLFLNGLIDAKQGTCGNMAVLHVAISRRLGWPVSLACAKSHLFSRFDDGSVIHNIETTSTHPGTFASDSDQDYVERFQLAKKAIDCGSDLRKLSAREMLGVFVSLRARHYRDIGEVDLADRDYALSRFLFPNYRSAYIDAMVPMLMRGKSLFDDTELGHPKSLFHDLAPAFGYPVANTAGQRAMTLSEFASCADAR